MLPKNGWNAADVWHLTTNTISIATVLSIFLLVEWVRKWGRMSAKGSHREGFTESEAMRPVVAQGVGLAGGTMASRVTTMEAWRAGWVWGGIDMISITTVLICI